MVEIAPNGYVSVPDACEQLHISKARMYQLIKMQMIPVERRGSRIWVTQEAVNARLAVTDKIANNCVTAVEVARFHGVDTRTVHDWVSRNLLHPVKVGNRLCFEVDEVVRFNSPAVYGVGRKAGGTPTRMLRGRHYPKPALSQQKGTE